MANCENTVGREEPRMCHKAVSLLSICFRYKNNQITVVESGIHLTAK